MDAYHKRNVQDLSSQNSLRENFWSQVKEPYRYLLIECHPHIAQVIKVYSFKFIINALINHILLKIKKLILLDQISNTIDRMLALDHK